MSHSSSAMSIPYPHLQKVEAMTQCIFSKDWYSFVRILRSFRNFKQETTMSDQTLLIGHAVSTNDHEVVKALLHLGVDPSQGIDGSVFSYAVEMADYSMVALLFQYLPDPIYNINAPNLTHWRPLHFAACLQDTEVRLNMLSWLLTHGADPNLETKRGETALTLVLWQSNRCTDSVHVLLQHGAQFRDQDVKDKDKEALQMVYAFFQPRVSAEIRAFQQLFEQEEPPMRIARWMDNPCFTMDVVSVIATFLDGVPLCGPIHRRALEANESFRRQQLTNWTRSYVGHNQPVIVSHFQRGDTEGEGDNKNIPGAERGDRSSHE